jgi:ATP/maltotriose-dependent transcriptional regulator MalT
VRIVLVGPPADRARLRQALAGTPVEIVREASTLAEARARGADADGFLIAARAPDEGRQDDDLILEPLTPRELDVLQLLAEGLANKAIARRLAICGKLGAANRTDAVRRAFQRGLVTI